MRAVISHLDRIFIISEKNVHLQIKVHLKIAAIALALTAVSLNFHFPLTKSWTRFQLTCFTGGT